MWSTPSQLYNDLLFIVGIKRYPLHQYCVVYEWKLKLYLYCTEFLFKNIVLSAEVVHQCRQAALHLCHYEDKMTDHPLPLLLRRAGSKGCLFRGTETETGFQTGSKHVAGFWTLSDGGGKWSAVKLSRSCHKRTIPYLEICDVMPDRNEKEEIDKEKMSLGILPLGTLQMDVFQAF